MDLAKLRYDALSSLKTNHHQEEVKERTTRRRTTSRCLKETIEGHLGKKPEIDDNIKGKRRSRTSNRGLEHTEELHGKRAGYLLDETQECHFFKTGQCWNGMACRYRHEREDYLYVLDPSVTLKTIDIEQYMHQFEKEVRVKLNKLGPSGSQFEVDMKQNDNIVLGEHFIQGVKVVMETKREMDRKRRDAAELMEKRTNGRMQTSDTRRRSRTERKCSGDQYKNEEFSIEGFEHYHRSERSLERVRRESRRADWDLLRVDDSRERRISKKRSKTEKRGRSQSKKGENRPRRKKMSSSWHEKRDSSLTEKLGKKMRRDASSSVLRERDTLSSCSELDKSSGTAWEGLPLGSLFV